MLGSLKNYDLYIKPHEDFRVKTSHGGIITVIAVTFMTYLFVYEWATYLTPEVMSDMRVDKSRTPSLNIELDVSMFFVPCNALTINLADVAGRRQTNFTHSLSKLRLDSEGLALEDQAETVVVDSQAEGRIVQEGEDAKTDKPRICGSCFGAETMQIPCCVTCEDVIKAYRVRGWVLRELDKVEQCVRERPELLSGWAAAVRQAKDAKEGCRISGNLTVNRVSGQLYFAVGHSVEQIQGSLIHRFPGMADGTRDELIFGSDYNHTFHKVHFGEDYLPEQENPLDGTSGDPTEDSSVNLGAKYTYFLKIVPTVYNKDGGEQLNAAQYSMTKYVGVNRRTSIPGVWLDYEISPMVIRYSEQRRSFSHFITNLCAIIGGVYAVAGVVDTVIYRTLRQFRRQQIGKD